MNRERIRSILKVSLDVVLHGENSSTCEDLANLFKLTDDEMTNTHRLDKNKLINTILDE